MDRRILVLPIAAVVILMLTLYRASRTYDTPSASDHRTVARPAPLFEASDSRNKRVRLARYIGRHRILLVFYDGERGADGDPLLMRIRENYDLLEAAGIVAVGVSTALPQQNRPVIEREGIAFPLLTDVAPFPIHRLWGRLDASGQPRTGAFLIDRKGDVPWSGAAPQPLKEPGRTLDGLLNESR